MNVPLSWLKDYIDIDLSLEELARALTMAGLEVDSVQVMGLPLPEGERHEFKYSGLSWDREKVVVAQIDEVMPHPNADRLVLCRLNDGLQEQVVLTGAPNLYDYKGTGPLPKPIKVAYAKEGAQIYDGHQPGQVLTTLKRAKIRGVESYSMVCSEKELGISEEHEGVIFLDDDAPTGMPLADYMGDAVFEISILPNMIRNASVLGVARELAAITGKPLRLLQRRLPADGPSVVGQVSIQIQDPAMNPRFVVGMLRGASARPSPYLVQRRLRLAGMRPINSIVDATNYVMLETGQPLHAFDYDHLRQRTHGQPPTIITRAAHPGEKLTTLDGVERNLDPFTTLVCDTEGALSIAGVMGGLESEVTPQSQTILLEGASWNFINVRRTVASQRLNSEAGYRFSRGIHPALAQEAVQLCLERMAAWSGGQIAADLVDAYPAPVVDPVVELPASEVQRVLGIDLSAEQVAGLLRRLEFTCTVQGDVVRAQAPAHRLDIGEGVVGRADLLEEVARLYGYNNIPAVRLSASLPRQRRNPALEGEERLRDALVRAGLREVATYRMTTPEREARALPLGAVQTETPYVRLANPIASDRTVMRRSLLASVLEVVERNSRLRPRLAFFEIGPVFLPNPESALPAEPVRLAMALSGARHIAAWDRPEAHVMDFFDLKGILEAAFNELHLSDVRFEPTQHPSFHPGKCALVRVGERVAGVAGELHPKVAEHYDFGAAPVLAAELDVAVLLSCIPARYEIQPVPVFPPVLEDIAVVVDEDLSAEKIEAVIRSAGGKLLTDVRLFDIYRGDKLGEGKKSMAYSLTYMAPDRTLTDQEATQIRQKVIRRLDQELGAKLRS